MAEFCLLIAVCALIVCEGLSVDRLNALERRLADLERRAAEIELSHFGAVNDEGSGQGQ